jgi:hypothetical protein
METVETVSFVPGVFGTSLKRGVSVGMRGGVGVQDVFVTSMNRGVNESSSFTSLKRGVNER